MCIRVMNIFSNSFFNVLSNKAQTISLGLVGDMVLSSSFPLPSFC